MTQRLYKGGAVKATLNSSITSADNQSFALTAVSGSLDSTWPNGTLKFFITIDRGLASEEKMLVTRTSGSSSVTVATGDRGKDDTTAQAHSAGAFVEHSLGALDLSEPNTHVNVTTGDDHTQYLKTDGTRAFTGVTAIANSTPTTSAVGDAAAIGSGNVLARSTHVHGREGLQVVNLSNVTPVTATSGQNIDLQSVTIPANTLKVGSFVQVYNMGQFTNCTTGTGSVTYTMTIGGTGNSTGTTLDGSNNVREFAVGMMIHVISLGVSGVVRITQTDFTNFYQNIPWRFGSDGGNITVNTTGSLILKTHAQVAGTGADTTSSTLSAVIFV